MSFLRTVGRFRRVLVSPWGLFAVALALRLAALLLVGENFSSDEYWAQFADTRFFRDVAEWFGDRNPGREGSLLLVGPGYGFILYAGSLFLGWNAVGHLALQVIVSALNCLLIRNLALRLGLTDAEATLAGYFSAFSLTALTLSVMLYSETWFVFLTLLALLSFLRSLDEPKIRNVFATAVLLAMAAYVRSVGQFLPFALLFALVVHALRHHATLKKALGALALGLGLISLWPLRNYVAHEVFTISETGTRAARTYWTASALAGGRNKTSIDSIRAQWDKELAQKYDTAVMSHKERHDFDVSVVRDTLFARPEEMIGAYISNVYDNMKQECRLQHALFPQLDGFWSFLSRRFTSGLGVWMILFSLLGGVLLWRRGAVFAAVFLVSVYLYFGLITGVTFWQDSRIFFPAQIVGAPLLAVAVLELFRSVSRLLGRLHSA